MLLLQLLVAFMVGGTVGFFVAALLAMAGKITRDEEIAEELRRQAKV